MSRATSPGWQSSPGKDLTKRQRAKLRANWQELAEYLAPSGIAWSWGESGLSERLKYYLRHHSLIVRDADDDSKWQTTEALWVAVLEDAADDEEIGRSAGGQCKLPQEARSSCTPSRAAGCGVHTTPGGRGGVETRQATLAGDLVETVNDEEATDTGLMEQNFAKGQSNGDPGERADRQLLLSRWTGIDTDVTAWDVTVSTGKSRLRRIDA